jgi:hypothetical protein
MKQREFTGFMCQRCWLDSIYRYFDFKESMKTITNSTGKTFKMGRRPIAYYPHRMSMNRLVNDSVLPQVTVPSTTNYSPIAAESLHNVYMNDQLGCCVVAGGYHVRGNTSFNAGEGVIFTDEQVINGYSDISGYDPTKTDADGNNPTDRGCNEETALSYWMNTGFPDGVKLIRAVAVDPTNVDQIKLAMYLFENLVFGAALPDDWINPMPEHRGFVWDTAGDPDPANGHCFIGCDLKEDGVKIDSWGMTGTITFPAIAKYCTQGAGGMLYTLLLPDVVNKLSQKTKAGYDISTLTKYLGVV